MSQRFTPGLVREQRADMEARRTCSPLMSVLTPLFLALLVFWMLALRSIWVVGHRRQLIQPGNSEFLSPSQVEVLTQVAGCMPPLKTSSWFPPIGYLFSWSALGSAHIFLGSIPWWSVLFARRRVWVLWGSETPASLNRAGRVLCRTETERLAARECLRALGRSTAICRVVGSTTIPVWDPVLPTPVAGLTNVSVLFLGTSRQLAAVLEIWAKCQELPKLIVPEALIKGPTPPNVVGREGGLRELMAMHPMHLCDDNVQRSHSQSQGALLLEINTGDHLAESVKELARLSTTERSELGRQNQARILERHENFKKCFPIARKEVFFFTGAYPAKTGGQVYNNEMIRELQRRHFSVNPFDLRILRKLLGLGGWAAVPYSLALTFVLGGRHQLFVVDQTYARWLAPALAVRALFRRGKLVLILHHMDDYDSQHSGLWRRLEHRAQVAHADLVITVSQFCKREVQSLGVPESRIQVISGGVSPKNLPAYSQRRPGMPLRLLFVGSCVARKGLAPFLQALSRMDRGSFVFHIVGDSETDYCRNEIRPLIQELNLSEQISIEGRVTQKQLAEFYQRADAFVFPSAKEGYGLAALEAMYCGLPVLCSRAAALPELVEDGKTGYLFSHGSVEQIEDVLQRVISHPEALIEMGREAHRKAQTQSTWRESRSRFFEALRPFLV